MHRARYRLIGTDRPLLLRDVHYQRVQITCELEIEKYLDTHQGEQLDILLAPKSLHLES